MIRKSINVVCFIAVLNLCAVDSAVAEFRAGTAKADVTPPIGSRMYGYGARGVNVSRGVHDPLFAKAVVLDDGETKVAIVTLDLGSFPKENTDNVRVIVEKETGIENILCVASHTHSAPRFSEDFPNESMPWVREMERKVADAIVRADKNLREARIGVGWGVVREGHNRRMIKPNGEVFMFWENRGRIPTVPLDYSLGVIRVEDNKGESIATLVNFACHPVVLGPENLQISADYVGAFTRMVEEKLGGQCMFLQGAPGDINPFWDKTPPDEGGFEQVEIMGSAVAKGVLDVTGRMGEYFADPKLNIHSEVILLAARNDPAREKRDIAAPIHTLLIGNDVALGFFPGEFFVEHGLALKTQSRFKHTFFVGYTNDALGYFPTIKATTEGGYGAASATRVEVGAGERLVNRALINLYYQLDMIKP
ncbi:MAG: neutral/alkaline non-lysosomal ceramidase N-terminal domain-containing protein [Planctomycetes bacterium]|nr:neutral/alkaline non-lysosomal ceramidase N-terminal domain-containing protein [Planctomycetota bacterium]